MALLVKKFGGSSVADLEKIQAVAVKIGEAYKNGDKLVVVVSAMQGETDRLLNMAYNLTDMPNARELDVLLATGEQITIALLSLALSNLGFAVKSYTGAQLGIHTDQAFNKARITNIDTTKILTDLDAGTIVVVAGFQGVDCTGNITTLGRGGLDTTAVALAAVLQADECQIYTDVDGIYTADPRIVSNARRMEHISLSEMLELASLGAKVLQIRSVEIAGRYNVPVRVLSTFAPGSGTLISYEDTGMEQQKVVGIAHSCNEAAIVVRGLPAHLGQLSDVLSPLAEANIEIDMLMQNVARDGLIDFSFTVQRSDLNKTLNIINPLVSILNIEAILVDAHVAKLSLVGVGMRSHPGITTKILQTLSDINVHIQSISTSEIKVSVILDEKYIVESIQALHEAFELDKGYINQNCQEFSDNLVERV